MSDCIGSIGKSYGCRIGYGSGTVETRTAGNGSLTDTADEFKPSGGEDASDFKQLRLMAGGSRQASRNADVWTNTAGLNRDPNSGVQDRLALSDAKCDSQTPPIDVAEALPGIDKVWAQGFTGKGQTIAIIDSGIYPHPDLKDKITGWVDISDGSLIPCDDRGHGTHVAGLAAGTGISSAGKHKGVAPDANVVGVRINSVSEAIKGIQWVVEHKDELHIGVVNMSLGDFAVRSYKDDPWAQAAEKAIEAGLVVCAAAGNNGRFFAIDTPGIHPDVITVGSLDSKGTPELGDDTVAQDMSCGPTMVDHLHKPDLLAPGVNIYGPMAPEAKLAVEHPEAPRDGQHYFAISGTSMATPMVAGMAAVLLSANPQLSHQEIKEILMRSADDYLPVGRNLQGAGVLNAERALELALNWDSGAEADRVAQSAERSRTPDPDPFGHDPSD